MKKAFSYIGSFFKRAALFISKIFVRVCIAVSRFFVRMEDIVGRFFTKNRFPAIVSGTCLAAGIAAGCLLGFEPSTYWIGTGASTIYYFDFKTALGWWIFSLILSVIIFLLCQLLEKQKAVYQNPDTEEEKHE